MKSYGGFFKAERWGGVEPMKGMAALQFLLAGMGAALLFSASWHFARAVFDDPFRIWRRQLVWMAMGAAAAWCIYRAPKSWIRQAVPALVWLTLALNLLTYVPGLGYVSGGARRWISLFGFTFQPSELSRVALVLYLARMLEKKKHRLGDFRNGVLPPLLVVAALVMTVYFQNDFSTAAYLLLLAIVLFFVAGLPWASVGATIAAALLGIATMLMAKPYRLARIKSWFRPDEDPAGGSYQILRARVALERGGLWGRGLGRGEVKRGGLPAAHSDFVAAVIGEETGYIGILIILGLFTAFAVKGWAAAGRSSDDFSRWAVFGLVAAVYWQVLVNLAVVSGILPATGTPLPLFSAGGSSAFMVLLTFGLIFNLAESR